MGLIDDLNQSFGADASSQRNASAGPSNSADGNRNVREMLLAEQRRLEAMQELNYDSDNAMEMIGNPTEKGFRLNYDAKAPLHAIDIGGEDQQQKLAEFVTSSIDNLSQGIDVKSAMKELGLKNARDIIPGLEVRLLGHQCIGVAWMLRMENSKQRGGILADDMGLGKTVQMIATMCIHEPTNADLKADPELCRTTLIVVPAALMHQWKEEVETKANGMQAWIHHGRDKIKTVAQLKKKDVVITSYQTLCQDFQVPGGVPKEEEEQWIAEHGGLLSKVKFFRIVADEAQFIRTRSTKASLALGHARAKFRWSLTGTPVTNSLADLYGLLRFGRFRPWNDWVDFNNHVARVQKSDAPLAGERAHVILKPLIMRRTKNSELEGKPILQLPPKDIELVRLKFTMEEREIYNYFEQKTKMQINKFIKEGTVMKNHSFILVLILRLRQICCHPNLVLDQTGDLDDPTLIMTRPQDAARELGRARKAMGVKWVNDLKTAFLLRGVALESLDADDDGGEDECSHCSEPLTAETGRVMSCTHQICVECAATLANAPIIHDGIFGYGSESQNAAAEKAFLEAEAKGHRPCPRCKQMVAMAPEKTFQAAAFEPTEEEIRAYLRSKRDKACRKNASRFNSTSFSRNNSSDTAKDVKMKSVCEISSDSDSSEDDMPDSLSLGYLKARAEKEKAKYEAQASSRSASEEAEDSDDMFSTNKPKLKSAKRKIAESDDEDDGKQTVKDEGNDSDIQFMGMSPASKARARAAKRVRKSTGGDDEHRPAAPDSSKKKGKANISGKQGAPSDATLATWTRGGDDVEPSTKMNALVNYLKEWDATGDKTICYSQWTSMLDLLETVLSRHGVRTLRFDGTMNRQERDQTIKSFKRSGGPKIILISTRCGSVGLNLVMANRVINMDLSWNYAAESQAYDRCHRIGQDKPVYVKRLVVENTIEERMLRLQEVKVGLADAALGEETGAKLGKLSVKDIRMLFGLDKKAAGAPPQRGSRSSSPG